MTSYYFDILSHFGCTFTKNNSVIDNFQTLKPTIDHIIFLKLSRSSNSCNNGTDCQGFPKDRKELILQYLSGLASPSEGKDQKVVRNFLSALGGSLGRRDPMFYLNIIQKMKGEWYNQEGKQTGDSNVFIDLFDYLQVSRSKCYS